MRILLAVDGESHTEAAVTAAFVHAQHNSGLITAIHAKDPYLKQFYNDIYAQGREEYLAHVDDCLFSLAKGVEQTLLGVGERFGVQYNLKVVSGDPYEVILGEVNASEYTLLVVGKRVGKRRFPWRPRDLSAKLIRDVNNIPILVVPGLY